MFAMFTSNILVAFFRCKHYRETIHLPYVYNVR